MPITFEQLGVDRLFVDESHAFKNLFLYTKMRNVAGLSTSEAQKSSDMFMKCRYMDELTGGRGVIFATGTPVSNSMTELYIEAFSKERNDEYVGRAEEYKAAKSALLEGLGLEHLFDHSHELTPKEKEIWMLFDRVDVAELLARDAFAKGAYMLGAEDREIMLK